MTPDGLMEREREREIAAPDIADTVGRAEPALNFEQYPRRFLNADCDSAMSYSLFARRFAFRPFGKSDEPDYGNKFSVFAKLPNVWKFGSLASKLAILLPKRRLRQVKHFLEIFKVFFKVLKFDYFQTFRSLASGPLLPRLSSSTG